MFKENLFAIKKAIQDAEPPKYNLTKPKPQPVIGPIKDIVRQWVEEDQSAPPKQRHTGRRIYERLVEEYGYKGSESGIRRLLGQLRRKYRETYVPLEFSPGSNAQCDWCEATAILDGEKILVQVFLLRLGSSRMPFVMAFPHQRQEAFFEGHKQAFIFWEGVPRSITYDNLKAAVFKVLRGRNRIEQNSFIAKTWEELNALLAERCLQYAGSHKVPGTSLTVSEAWEVEKKHL
ncbi:MAG: hypothetical protein AB1633_13265, partial [Elusimicrobiota bacterium]